MGRRLSHYTTDHDRIREWAEERGGQPAAVARTRRGEDDPGIIRIDFPGYSGEQSLKKITWKEFFKKFDDNNLVLVFQDQTSRGQRSNFNKIISAQSAADAESDDWDEGGASNRSRGSSRPGRSETSSRSSRSASRAGGGRGRSSGTSRSATSRSSRNTGGARTRSANTGGTSRGRTSSSARSGRDADSRGASRGGTQRSRSRSGSASRGRSRTSGRR